MVDSADSPRTMIKSVGERLDVLVEDDGRVAYAYLLDGGTIISDVWLYNRCASPAKPEWSDRTKAPFSNPVQYARDIAPKEVISDESWSVRDSGNGLDVIVEGMVWARLKKGAKPGWCIAARIDGPLARVLEA